MRAGDYLDCLLRMPLASVGTLTDGLPFVVLAPHPDDETLGAGGLIAAACEAGQAAEVVVITDGSGSHPRSQLYPRQRLIDLRRREVERAGALLGLAPGRIHHLGLPDTRAPKEGPAFEAAIKTILAIVRQAGARSLFATWPGDPHCDHEAAALMAHAVARCLPDIRLWAYPVWGWHLDPVLPVERPRPRGFRIDISRHQARKRSALAAHLSQMTDLVSDDPEGFRFSAAKLEPFLGPFEYFIEMAR